MADNRNVGRVVVVFSSIGPGHHARLAAAGELGDVYGLEVTSVERSRHPGVPFNATQYQRVTLLHGHPGDRHRGLWWPVREALNKIEPRVVAIPGWSNQAGFAAMKWCLQSGAAVVLMGDTHVGAEQRAGIWRSVKRRIVRMCGGGLVAGSPQARYLNDLGMPRARIFTGYDVVDNDHFSRGAVQARANAAAIRTQLALPPKYFLCVSRLAAEKNLAFVIRAFREYRNLAGDDAWSLVIVGEGPEETAIRSVAEAPVFQGNVLLAGYREYGILPNYYGLAGAFILASVSETWGLAVNEAMAAGLPVLVSRCCGCAEDLVQDGVNGFTFDPRDEKALTGLMLALSAGDLEAMGKAGQEIIRQWPLRRFAEGLWTAALVASQGTSRGAGLLDRVLLEGLEWL